MAPSTVQKMGYWYLSMPAHILCSALPPQGMQNQVNMVAAAQAGHLVPVPLTDLDQHQLIRDHGSSLKIQQWHCMNDLSFFKCRINLGLYVLCRYLNKKIMLYFLQFIENVKIIMVFIMMSKVFSNLKVNPYQIKVKPYQILKHENNRHLPWRLDSHMWKMTFWIFHL